MTAFTSDKWMFDKQDINGIDDHVTQCEDKFKWTKMLSGTYPMDDNDLKDLVFHTFPIVWTENLLIKGTTHCKNSTLQGIVEHKKLESGKL